MTIKTPDNPISTRAIPIKTIPANHIEVEHLKLASNYLRGTIEQGLGDGATGSLAEGDTQLTKFHGFYQQDDRDVRDERRRQMLEPDHSFMIRARVGGGVCTPAQWLALDEIATRWTSGSVRLTTRQTFQYHGVLKNDLKKTLAEMNKALLGTIAACGDVNRNVMCTPLPEASAVHRAVFADAMSLNDHLIPATPAYNEIWLDQKKVTSLPADTEVEPIYGATYLPRKFKVGFAIPPQNDIDVLANDLGFIAIIENDQLLGYNVTVGGGMGASHNEPATFPRIADVIGFCTSEQVNQVAEKVVTIQRDFGDRTNRKHARFKYTIADRGVEWFIEELESRLGFKLGATQPYNFTDNGDRYGWQQGDNGLWHLGLYIENGRIIDNDKLKYLTGFRKIAQLLEGEFRMSPNQNIIISNVKTAQRGEIDALVKEYGLDGYKHHSLLRLNSMACVAFPTCGLAMAESERYLPDLLSRIDKLLDQHGLGKQAITIRMTGCPNGCARPYLAEIGLVGKAPGRYNLHLGAAFNGTRLNQMLHENLDEKDILTTLDGYFSDFSLKRTSAESFGDFVQRVHLANSPGNSPVGDGSNLQAEKIT
jgi:sulfite reductase (NADPH) hemoprotein beta-component